MNTILVVFIIIVLLIIVIWAADRYLSLPQPFKGIIIFLIVLIAAVFILYFLKVI